MTDMVLFHHVLGLTSGIRAWAQRLEVHGHVVHTPDLFDGRVFHGIDEGLAYVDEVGIDTIVRRGQESVADLPDRVVVAGSSFGVVAAQALLQTRQHVLGAVFLHAFCAPDSLPGRWPGEVHVQVHGMADDPFFAGEGDLAVARAVDAEYGNIETYLYPGSGHLFTDSSGPDYDPQASETVRERVVLFLDHLADADM